MNMLPWYRIRMCDTNIKCAFYDQVALAMGEYRRSVKMARPALSLLVKREIGMQLLDPYPGKIPNYDR